MLRKFPHSFLISLLFSLFFALSSCSLIVTGGDTDSNQTTSGENSGGTESEKGEYCTVSLSLGIDGARAVLPNYDASAYFYKLSYTNSSAEVTNFPSDGSAISSTQLTSSKLTLLTGEYRFALDAYSNSECTKKVLMYSEKLTITAETTEIKFTLKDPNEYESGSRTGSLSVPITFPASANIASASAKLCAISSPSTATDEQTLTISDTADGKKSVTYTASGIVAGTYILYITLADSSGYTTVIPEMVKIASNMESVPDTTTENHENGVIVLDEKMANVRYSITYENMSDGAGGDYWASVTTVSLSFVAGQTVTLPTKDNVSRTGYFFAGWYENENFSGEAVTSIGENEIGNKIFYARWRPTLIYVSQGGNDDSGTGEKATPYATLQKAIDFINEIADDSLDWSIYVTETVTGCTSISTLAAKSLVIEKESDATSATLDGQSGGTVLLLAASVPVTLKNFTITGGNATNGGGLNIASGATVTLADGAVISGNKATQFGGGVYNAGTLFMSGNAVIGKKDVNSVATADDCSNKASSHGGGIYNAGGKVYIGYTDSETPDDSFTGGIFYNYSGYQGGGMYSTGSATIKMYGGEISYNGSKSDGGGVRLGGSEEFTVLSGKICKNIANYETGNGGGGIYIGGGSSAILSGGEISGNSAYKGNGIYNNGGTLKMSGGIKIGSGNDVFLPTNALVTLADTFTETSVATITPGAYSADTQVLSGSALGSDYSKFAVALESPNNVVWEITEEGKLYKEHVTSGTVGDIGFETPSGAGDLTYYYTLYNVTRPFSNYSSALTFKNNNAGTTLTVYLTLIGNNSLTGDNHGGLKLTGAPGANINVIFCTTSTGTLKCKGSIQDVQVENVTGTFSKQDGLYFTSATSNGTSYNDMSAFFTAAQLQLSNKGSTFTLSTTDVPASGGTVNGVACNDVSSIKNAIKNATGEISLTLGSNISNDDYKIILDTVSNAGNITSISLDLGNLTFIPENDNESMNRIINNTSKLVSLVMPKGITKISQEFFQNARNLVSLTISKDVKEIAANAFANCEKLTYVDFVEKTGWRAGSTEISSTTFANTTTTATYLKTTYKNQEWTKNTGS